MRKSAVSVRSGAGMPAHMASRRNAGGGEEMYGRERKGQISLRGSVTLLMDIWEDTQEK